MWPKKCLFTDGRSACNHTKFDDASFSHSRDIAGRVKFQNTSRGPDHDHLGDIWSSEGYYFSWPNRAQNLKSVALAVPKIFHGV